ncbi:hypothetical protein LTR70_007433 [Exophiala xenobiotica]|uniref:Uncharacterized protein n=1 Tax=Lithohypha guttulata TaxID=1690604 RepID=A0ABR0K4F6_9EURO|nr:hypothetical protein LTR24_006973 [Lithohypha guttulata]KAK5313790.1 hypothetical protein LTR70_007433 [Exophiala xenobiotica]
MVGESQAMVVDDIADDDKKLEEKAQHLVRDYAKNITELSGWQSGLSLVIDKQETVGKEFEVADRSVRAILVKKDSSAGAVRVFGQSIRNVVTGPKEQGYALVIVATNEEWTYHVNICVVLVFLQEIEELRELKPEN